MAEHNESVRLWARRNVCREVDGPLRVDKATWSTRPDRAEHAGEHGLFVWEEFSEFHHEVEKVITGEDGETLVTAAASIRRAEEAGATVTDIARTIGIGRQRVYKILERGWSLRLRWADGHRATGPGDASGVRHESAGRRGRMARSRYPHC